MLFCSYVSLLLVEVWVLDMSGTDNKVPNKVNKVKMSFEFYNILSLNINGLNNPIKRRKLIAKLKEKISLAFWPETHLSNNEHEKFKMGLSDVTLLNVEVVKDPPDARLRSN